jgi:REP element-mobilizing transposase RayT
MDGVRSGAKYLAQERIARLVTDALLAGKTNGFCSLDSFVVMPNHVHVLWTPVIGLGELVRRVKGPVAVEANRILCTTGQKFWQEEYFDRIVRTEREAARIRGYIDWNPVKAGLVGEPSAFPWSSARLRNPDGGLQPARGFSSAVGEHG